MNVSVFIGTSVDGFIARPNGDLDFLPEGGGEPHGYDEFIASVDALVIGRKTFETVLTFATWPYGDKRVVVLSSRPLDLSAVRGGVVEQMAGPPASGFGLRATGCERAGTGCLQLLARSAHCAFPSRSSAARASLANGPSGRIFRYCS